MKGEKITLLVGQTAKVSVALQQSASETITVSAEVPIVDVHKSDSSTNIAPQQSFYMTARDWSRDKSAGANGDSKTGTALSKVRDFDEPKLWWPGGASANNLVFRIALIEFDNGTKWQADEVKGSLW